MVKGVGVGVAAVLCVSSVGLDGGAVLCISVFCVGVGFA
jgi:hypothetical protein